MQDDMDVSDNREDYPPESAQSTLEGVARTEIGGKLLERKLVEHHESSPMLSGGDIDAAWEDDTVGEESVGGGNPTPDQDVVEELGRAVGVTYEDNEPLRVGEKVAKRDEDRWELDPASAEDSER